MARTALDMLRVAASQLGITEMPPGSNRTKYGAWYGMDGAPWCDMFVSWCADQSGNADAVGRFAYTPYHAAWFQRNGRWTFGTNGIRPGDIVFYGGGAWGSAGGIGGIQHVGTVERVISPTIIQALEANTSAAGSQDNGGAVLRKQRNVSLVCGYGRPAYAASAPVAPAGVYLVKGVQRAPSNPGFAAALQRRLGIHADGAWGPQTTATLITFQRAHGLAGDGVIGAATARALGWAFRP